MLVCGVLRGDTTRSTPRLGVARSLPTWCVRLATVLLAASPDQGRAVVEELVRLCPASRRCWILDEPGAGFAFRSDCGAVPVRTLRRELLAEHGKALNGAASEREEAGLCFTSARPRAQGRPIAATIRSRLAAAER